MTKAQLKVVEETTQLIPVENVNAVTLFSEGGNLQELLDQIETEATAHVPDLETVDSRKAVAANAYNVARSKTAIDKAGKDLVAGEKAKLKEIDNRRKHAREFLDEVRDRVRKPLTDYEAEQEAIAQAQADQDALNAAEEEAYHLNDLWDREAKLAAWEEEQKALEAAKAEKEKAEAAAAERAATAKRIRKETEERVAQEAEAAIQAEKDRADQAEKDRVAAEEQAEQDKLDAAEKAEQEKLDAIEQERIRVATKAAEDKAEEERLAEIERKRAENVEHRRTINNEIVAAFVEHEYHETMAQHIVTLIATGKIPHTEIRY